jgi:rod shape-determining protein MreC
MDNLIAFFIRFYLVILFIFLQVICIYLVIDYNNYQNAKAFEISSGVQGKLMSKFESITDYLSLKKVNDSLLNENARLHSALLSSKMIDTFYKGQQVDSIIKQKFTFIGIRLLKNTVNQRNNYITLSGGKKHGIDKDMGVIASSGIIGITRASSDNFTSVISVLHKDFKISAIVTETGNIGSIIWNGINPNVLTLEINPTQSKFKEGTLYHVMTSAYSDIFPENLPIGTFTKWKVNADNSISAEVHSGVDMTNLKTAYVINNIYKNEQKAVELIPKPKAK